MTKKEIQMSIDDMKYMSSGQQIKRFSRYLNQSFYLGADLFLKTKHEQFLKQEHPRKAGGTVFSRLERDKKARDKESLKLKVESNA